MKSLSSSAGDRVRELKRDLVLQVYLGRGLFWEAVNRARIVQGVEAEASLPPPQHSPPYSEDAPQRPQSWRSAIRAAWEPVVPQRYWQASDWDEFTAACVRYDPPELDLAEFAKYGGLTSEGVEHSREEQESGEGRTIAPPVEYIDSVGQRADALEEFYRGVIEELGRRHFAPLGEDVYQAISDIYNGTDLLERLQTRMREIEIHPYIAVDKDTSDEDVLSAARVIRARRGKNPGGRPSRDKLTAIKCATLFHDHNFKDPQNKGRSRYTYESLVEKFELDPAENAREVNKQDHKERERRKAIGKEYVRLGEQLRKERQRNRGV